MGFEIGFMSECEWTGLSGRWLSVFGLLQKRELSLIGILEAFCNRLKSQKTKNLLLLFKKGSVRGLFERFLVPFLLTFPFLSRKKKKKKRGRGICRELGMSLKSEFGTFGGNCGE